MVGVAFNTGHHFGVNDILGVTLVHKNVVSEVAMFGPRMHPGCFKSVLLLEDGVGNKLLLSTKLQQQAPVVVAVTNVSAKYSFPGICILAHSGIEITRVLWRQLRSCLFLQVQIEELERTHRKVWHAVYFSESAWTSCGQNDRLADFPVWRR